MDEMLNKKDVLDAIEKKMKVVNEADGDADVILGLAAAMSTVKKMEAAPVGKWRIDIDKSRGIDWRRFYCPSCNEWQTYGETPYCPNCGRKVDKRIEVIYEDEDEGEGEQNE